jgi:membrane protease subunit (stomatin/prohibitin family)
MAIIDFLKKQFIDIIEWTDDSRDTLSFRFPDEDKEIKKGAQLIVRESQTAQFVYLGQFGDTFGPGKYTLTTDNIPILTNLKSWKYALESPFKADVYYVVTRVFTGNKWGTANPVMMRDADSGSTNSTTRCDPGSSACSPTPLRARRFRRSMSRRVTVSSAPRCCRSSIPRSPKNTASR